MSNAPLLLVHFVGLTLSVGSLLIFHFRFASYLAGRRANRFDTLLVERFAPAVKLGLVLLWSSRLGLLVESAVDAPYRLADPKLHAKILIVVILTINGILVEKLCLPVVARSEGRGVFASLTLVARVQLIVIAAISMVSWYFALLLGMMKQMNLIFAAEATTILKIYGGALASVAIVGLLIVRRIPQSARAAGLELSSARSANVTTRQAKNFLSFLRKRLRNGLLGVVASSFVIHLLMLTTAVYLMQVLDRVLADHGPDTLIYLTVIAVITLIILLAFDVMRRRMLIRMGSWLERSLASPVFLKELESTRAAKFRSMDLFRDLSTLRACLSSTSMLAPFDVLWLPVDLVLVYALNPLLGLIALIGTTLVFCIICAARQFTRSLLKDAREISMSGMRTAETALRNLEVVNSMSMGPALAKMWNQSNEQTIELNRQASNRTALVIAICKFLELVTQVLVIAAGVWLVFKHQLTVGAMIAATLVLAGALRAMEQMILGMEKVAAARQSWRRVRGSLAQKLPDFEILTSPRPFGHLTIEAVTYAPSGITEPVIRGISMDVRPGEVLAITGPSGSGKSTLARLMLGLSRPQIGVVRLDGAEISLLDRRQIGQHIGYSPQELELFPGTVYQNIARMSEGTTSDLIEAAHLAGVHEVILSLPMGYDTIVGQEGCGLSGGQRRRIALARAFYGRPALLVLDEPTGSLDTTSENVFGQAINQLRDIGTTIVLLVSQPALLAYADRIAVLNGGRLSIIGSRDQVLAELTRPHFGRRRSPHMRIIR
jgi:PrtD family type I secretion system ABC transporter